MASLASIIFTAKKFKENEKPRIRARERHHQQKEAHPVSAARLADTCPRNSALCAESVSGLVVELERVIGVCEVFLRVFFDFFVGVDPVKQLCSLA